MTRWIASVVLLVACLGEAHATWSFGLESQAGARRLDDRLADYRWAVGPVPVLGLDAVATHGRWSLRAGASRSGTEQATGLPGAAPEPSVSLTELSIGGGVRLVDVGPVRLDAGASIGRLHLRWDPERLDLEVDGTPVNVAFEPIDRWTRAVDLTLAWAPRPSLHLGLRGRALRFDLDTAHRAGDAIVERTESFDGYDLTLFVRALPWRTTTSPESRP